MKRPFILFAVSILVSLSISSCRKKEEWVVIGIETESIETNDSISNRQTIKTGNNVQQN